jgi:hypothetical protein
MPELERRSKEVNDFCDQDPITKKELTYTDPWRVQQGE